MCFRAVSSSVSTISGVYRSSLTNYLHHDAELFMFFHFSLRIWQNVTKNEKFKKSCHDIDTATERCGACLDRAISSKQKQSTQRFVFAH